MSGSFSSTRRLTRLAGSAALALGLACFAMPARAEGGDAYKDALRRADQGDFASARRLAAKGGDPLLAKVVRWLDLTRSADTASFAELSSFLKDNPDWPAQATLRYRAEQAIALEGSDKAALAWFTKDPPDSREGRTRLAEIQIAQGKIDEGNRLLRRVWVEEAFAPADERAFLDKYRGVLSPADHIAKLDRQLWRNQTDAARRQMARVDPDQRSLAEARLKFLASQGGVDGALAKVPARLQDDPGLLYARIRWSRLKGRDDAARALLLKAPQELVRPDLWWDERQIQIRRALDDGETGIAYRLARDHRLTSGADFAEAEFLAGWIALRLRKDPQDAERHFRALYDAVLTPVSLARGAYWTGRALEAQGKGEDARGWYRKGASYLTTFYGQLSAVRLDSAQAAALVRLPPEPDPPAELAKTFEKRELARVVRRLASIDEERRIDAFVLRLADLSTTPETAALTARLAKAVGRTDLAVQVSRRVYRDGIVLPETGYPLAPVERAGPAEPALVNALIRQESQFAANAVSPAGARGLMQLMPATAKQMAREVDLPFAPNRLTSDARYNVRLGQAYIGHVLDNFAGSYMLAIAAYNAGPGRVREWMKRYGDPRDREIDVIDWIERIPFAETRNYVQRVLEGLQVYRLRLGNERVLQIAHGAPPAASPWCLIACTSGANAALQTGTKTLADTARDKPEADKTDKPTALPVLQPAD